MAQDLQRKKGTEKKKIKIATKNNQTTMGLFGTVQENLMLTMAFWLVWLVVATVNKLMETRTTWRQILLVTGRGDVWFFTAFFGFVSWVLVMIWGVYVMYKGISPLFSSM
jgi:hypothetical protein